MYGDTKLMPLPASYKPQHVSHQSLSSYSLQSSSTYHTDSSVSDTHRLLSDHRSPPPTPPAASRSLNPHENPNGKPRERRWSTSLSISDLLMFLAMLICATLFTLLASFLYILLGGHILKYPSIMEVVPSYRYPYTTRYAATGPFFLTSLCGSTFLGMMICALATAVVCKRRSEGVDGGKSMAWITALTVGCTIAGMFALALGARVVGESHGPHGYDWLSALKAGGVGGGILCIPIFLLIGLIIATYGDGLC
ncbi:hypothetical protein C8Q74DRAFT_1250489 [Fomes fomentarius]|nr:hypothetical protein C8Q74DRAFT_1250489 [Fomes fomentarius]